MTADPYSPEVRALFSEPAHAGRLEAGYSTAVDDQGLRLTLFAAVEGGIIEALRFLAWGCPHVIAAAEAFCRDFEGRDPADLLEFSSSGLMQSLPVPVEKTGRILVLEDAVRSLGNVVREALEPQKD